jgi:putative glutamine amidotransferase
MPVVVGIPTCATVFNNKMVHATPARYADALAGGAAVLSIMIPPMGPAQSGLLERIDGLVVPGSASNVHPSNYGTETSLTPELHDPARDATTLPLIRGAFARGIPILAICRGIQELNVALGGTLHQNVHDKPGRYDHRGESGDVGALDFGPKHVVALTGSLARIVRASEITVNSLHSQAIDILAFDLVAEATAEDGTIEAVSGANAPGFVLGLQWHPEWRYAENPASLAIFRAFGEACREHQHRLTGRYDVLSTPIASSWRASEVVHLHR